MKKLLLRAGTRGSAAGVCVVLCLALAARAENPGMDVKVLRVKGKVRYSADGRSWQTVKAGEVLARPGTIQTAKKDAEVELQLGDLLLGETKKKSKAERLEVESEPVANRVRLFENSGLDLQQVFWDGSGGNDRVTIELNLRAGQMLGSIRKLGPGSRYEVTHQSGVIGAGGGSDSQPTVFLLRSSGALAVPRGRLVAASAGAEVRTQTVSAGEQFDPATGKVTALPPEPGERKAPPAREEDVPAPAKSPARISPMPAQRPLS